MHHPIPDGDVLIHAGDFCGRGTLLELQKSMQFFKTLPHKYKICVAGNHDWCLFKEKNAAMELLWDAGFIYLEDCSHEIEGWNFYGSPWQPEFCNWAFNLPRGGEQLKSCWDKIPRNTDVLITHTPPTGILDKVESIRWSQSRNAYVRISEEVGCELLRHRLADLDVSLHVFGHIHCSRGIYTNDSSTFVNAAICGEEYIPWNPPIELDLVEKQ